MIQSFSDRETGRFFETRRAPRTGWQAISGIAARKLDMLDAALMLDDLMSPPGNRLEALKGDLTGWHSIRINQQWRICFRWTPRGPADVSIEDYH